MLCLFGLITVELCISSYPFFDLNLQDLGLSGIRERLFFVLVLVIFLVTSIYGIYRTYILGIVVFGILVYFSFHPTNENYLALILPGYVFLVLFGVPIMYFIGKIYYKTKLNNKIYSNLLLITPFIFMIVVLVLSFSTCAFGNNIQCNYNKVVSSGDIDSCFNFKNGFDDIKMNMCVINSVIQLQKTKKDVVEVCNFYKNDNNGIKPEYRTIMCYGVYAKLNKDPSFCDGFDAEKKDFCLSYYNR